MKIYLKPDEIEEFASTHEEYLKSNWVKFAETDDGVASGIFTEEPDTTYTIMIMGNDVTYDSISEVLFEELEWHIADAILEVEDYEAMNVEPQELDWDLVNEKFTEFLETIGINIDNLDNEIIEEIINDLAGMLEKII